jgi:26S proteasome regulatory subunit N2
VVLLTDTKPSDSKTLLELKSKKKGPSTTTNSESLISRARQTAEQGRSRRDGTTTGTGGAEAAVGVLTAVDEDEEGGEEAEVPREFGYETDGDAFEE